MKEAINNWLMIGIGVLIIGLIIFGTLYSDVTNKSQQMHDEVTGTNLPANTTPGS